MTWLMYHILGIFTAFWQVLSLWFKAAYNQELVFRPDESQVVHQELYSHIHVNEHLHFDFSFAL